MPYAVSDPSITPGNISTTYGYNSDYDFGNDTVWGNQWKQAISRGDNAFAQKLEGIMRAQKNAPGMQNATNAWWNNRLNTGSVPTNTQPLDLGTISVTSKNDQGYQNIGLGQTPNVSPTGITYSGGPTGGGWDMNTLSQFYKKPANSLNGSLPSFNSVTPNNGGNSPVSYNNGNNGAKSLADIDWTSSQNFTNGNTVPNRQWNSNTGTYSNTGY